VDFRHTSPPKEMKVPQHKHSLIEQFSLRGEWRLVCLTLCSASSSGHNISAIKPT